MSIATQLPTEKRVLQDEKTGAAIWQLTNAPCVNHAPYFLNPAWAGANHDMLIITSYRIRRAQSLRHPVAGRHVAATDDERRRFRVVGVRFARRPARLLRRCHAVACSRYVNLARNGAHEPAALVVARQLFDKSRRIGNPAGGPEGRQKHHPGRAHRWRRRTRAVCHRSICGARAVESRRTHGTLLLGLAAYVAGGSRRFQRATAARADPSRSGSPTRLGCRTRRSSLPIGPTH